MTVRTAWLINDTMSGEDIRLSQTASMVHDTAIRSRSGVIPAPSNPLQVTVGSGMTVNVAAGQLSIGGQRAGAQGTYVITNDATLALTIANGDAAQPRTDAIVGYVRDTTYGDTTQVGGIAVITGTAGVSFPIPTYTGTTALGTAVLLGTIKVLANTTAGGGGLSAMGAVLTDQRVYTATVGSAVVVTGQAQRDALTAYDSLQVYRLDTDSYETYNGTSWLPDLPMRVLTDDAAPLAGTAWDGVTQKINIKKRTTVTLTGGSGVGTLTFSPAFPNGLLYCTVSMYQHDKGVSVEPVSGTFAKTGLSVQALTAWGVGVANGALVVFYDAIGW